MPQFKTAKQIAEDALSTIGAFPASQYSPDPGELRKALRWLEMILNTQVGIRPMAGAWRIVDIPLEENVGDYELADYEDAAGTQYVFSANLVDSNGNVDPLDMMYENVAVEENLSDIGTPDRVVITKDARPMLRVFPTPQSFDVDAGRVVRIRIQTYQSNIDETGVAGEDVFLRPAWYLWCNNRLSYEIGKGPVRRLMDKELDRLQKDYEKLETALLARDGQYNSSRPPLTEPMQGS